jgi:hypothetical protein
MCAWMYARMRMYMLVRACVCMCAWEHAYVRMCSWVCARACTCMCGSARVCACEHECAPECAGLCKYTLVRAGVCWGVHTGGSRSSSMSTEILDYTWVSFAQQMFWERLLGGGCRDPKIKLQIKQKNIKQIDRARPKRSRSKSTWARLCAAWWQHVCAQRSVAQQIWQR